MANSVELTVSVRLTEKKKSPGTHRGVFIRNPGISDSPVLNRFN